MTSDDDEAAALVEESLDALFGKVENGVRIPAAVGSATRVAEVDEVVVWQRGAKFAKYGEAAVARIIDTDHVALLVERDWMPMGAQKRASSSSGRFG
jgi:N-acetylglutamate synthase/N-acetylornithine aminotransferase